MQRLHIDRIKEHIGKQVKIAGFVQTIRDQGNIIFSSVIPRELFKLLLLNITSIHHLNALAVVKILTHESVVEIIGLLKEEKQAPSGFEIEAEEIRVLSLADPALPIPIIAKGQQGETEQSTRLDWRWIDLRKPQGALTFKVWTELEASLRDYFGKSVMYLLLFFMTLPYHVFGSKREST